MQKPALTIAEKGAIRSLTHRLTHTPMTPWPPPKGWMKLRNLLEKSFLLHRKESPDRWGNMVYAFFEEKREAPDRWCEEALLALAVFRMG